MSIDCQEINNLVEDDYTKPLFDYVRGEKEDEKTCSDCIHRQVCVVFSTVREKLPMDTTHILFSDRWKSCFAGLFALCSAAKAREK